MKERVRIVFAFSDHANMQMQSRGNGMDAVRTLGKYLSGAGRWSRGATSAAAPAIVNIYLQDDAAIGANRLPKWSDMDKHYAPTYYNNTGTRTMFVHWMQLFRVGGFSPRLCSW